MKEPQNAPPNTLEGWIKPLNESQCESLNEVPGKALKQHLLHCSLQAKKPLNEPPNEAPGKLLLLLKNQNALPNEPPNKPVWDKV